jgi:hypothetical protein
MHDVVLSNLHIKLKSLRRPSFAGNGLPERMRSTAFAFLGLTAALGLALVATFAQLSFPVLAPAPPPSGPAGQSGVSASLALGGGRTANPPQPAFLAAAVPAGIGAGGRSLVRAGRGDGRVGEVGSPIPVEESRNAVAPNDDGSPAEPPPSPAPAPSGEKTASVEAAPAASPTPLPTSPDPKPVTSNPKPKPGEEQPEPEAEEPEPATPEPKPGKGPKPPKAEVPPPPAPTPPAPEAPAEKGNPGNGKGKALGHYK